MTASTEDRFVALKWRFKGPIKIGDTLHVRVRVIDKRDGDEAGRGLVTMERLVLNQHGVVVQQGETEHLIGRRGG